MNTIIAIKSLLSRVPSLYTNISRNPNVHFLLGRSHRTVSFLARDQSPMERLIERSRRRYESKKEKPNLCNMLPTYVLNLCQEVTSFTTDKDKTKQKFPVNDGRLATRLIINEDIQNLVSAVLEALQRSNPTKFAELLSTARDLGKLQNIMKSPSIQEFVCSLNSQPILSSCESFHLSQPFKYSVPLNVTAPHPHLENLIFEIRNNVLRSSTSAKESTPKLKKSSIISTSSRKNELPSSIVNLRYMTKQGSLDVERLAYILKSVEYLIILTHTTYVHI